MMVTDHTGAGDPVRTVAVHSLRTQPAAQIDDKHRDRETSSRSKQGGSTFEEGT